MTTSDQWNPYRPPKAPLDVAATPGPTGSFEDAIGGSYDFTIADVMREAWGLVDGFKGPFWGAALVIYGLLFGASFAWRAIWTATTGNAPNLAVRILFQVLVTAVMTPLLTGLIAMAVRRAAREPVSFSMAFSYLNRAPVFIMAGFLTSLLTYLGMTLLLIPGIYLSIAYGMALPVLAFHQLGAWEAMEASRTAVTHRWWGVFLLYLVIGVLIVLSVLPLGIPVIWTGPWAVLVVGVLYRRMFGVPADVAPS
jgi:uncharacterized membrane protein